MIHLPLCAFENFLGFNCVIENNEVIIAKDDKKLNLSINSSSKDAAFAKNKEGATYLPVNTVFSYFDIPFEVFNN